MSRPRRLAVIAALVILGLLVVDTAGWWLVTARMESEFAAWQRDQTAAGYAVTAGTPVRSGWPLRAILAIPAMGVAIGTPGSVDRIAWRGGEARLIYAPWRPTEVNVILDDTQSVQFGSTLPIAIGIQSLDVVVPLNQSGQADGIVATARHVGVPLPGGTLGIDALWIQLGASDVHLSLSAVTLPGRALPLGPTIGSIDLHASSTVKLPALREPAAAATAWRDAGGQLVIGDIAVGWGPLDVRGSATLGLDSALQPTGNGAVRVTGFTETIEALARAGVISRNDARVASTLLGLMSHAGSDGVAQADLPLNLRNGLLSAGAIPLMKLPPLALP